MTYKEEVDCFTGKLKEILDAELDSGNRICEAYKGDWPYPQCVVIMLANSFSQPVHKDLDGIVFRNINDPHYWKAEYYDAANNLLLTCKFGGIPDFDDL